MRVCSNARRSAKMKDIDAMLDRTKGKKTTVKRLIRGNLNHRMLRMSLFIARFIDFQCSITIRTEITVSLKIIGPHLHHQFSFFYSM